MGVNSTNYNYRRLIKNSPYSSVNHVSSSGTSYLKSIALLSDDSIIVGGGGSLYRLSTTYSVTWSLSIGQAYAITTDSSDNILVVDGSSAANSVARKVSSGGTTTWSFTHSNWTTDIDVDSSDNVYFSGYRVTGTGTCSVRKLNSAGTEQWTYDQGENTTAIRTDNTYVYIASSTLKKLNVADGSQVWSVSIGWTAYAIDYDNNGNIYVCSNGGNGVKKYNSSGVLVWSYAGDGGQIWSIFTDKSTGDSYIGARSKIASYGYKTLYKLSTNGQLIWSVQRGDNNTLDYAEEDLIYKSPYLYTVGTYIPTGTYPNVINKYVL
jgi:hypothetical protein